MSDDLKRLDALAFSASLHYKHFTPKEVAFLKDMAKRAESPGFRMTEKQRVWFEALAQRRERIVAERRAREGRSFDRYVVACLGR